MLRLMYLIFLASSSHAKIIDTSYGKVQGATLISDDENHKYMFKSVPFAKPPIGDLRFALPQMPDSWEGVLDATEYSAACMINVTNSRWTPKNIDEDCLYINIFTSENCLKNKCAVIVYIHGGSYLLDSAIMFPDDFILERYVTEDVVFVIPAFRLGALGQLYFGQNEILKENLLLFDVIHALKFVNQEINNFGGDSSKVTLMGHSTGAFVVNAMGFSDLIDPNTVLFQQMIVLSAPGEFGFEDLAIESSFKLAEKLKCYSVESSNSSVSEILSCMRRVSAHDILRVQSEMVRENKLVFRSIIRGAPIMVPGEKISDFKKHTSVRNILYGTTENEFLLMNKHYGPHAAGSFMDFENPLPVILHFYDIYPAHKDDWVEIDSAGVFVSARTYCEAMVNAGADVYLFETRQEPMSMHVSDMQYFIGVHRELNHTSDMDILDSFYSKMLVNFTKTGVPSPNWPKLDPQRMNYLELKIDTEKKQGPNVKENFHETEMNVWYGELMDYDRNLTKQKHNTGSSHSTIFTNRPVKEKSEQSIFKQWWFYTLISLILVISVLLITCLRRRREEEIPLLR